MSWFSTMLPFETVKHFRYPGVPPKGKIEAHDGSDEQGHALRPITMLVVPEEPDSQRDEQDAKERERRSYEAAGARESHS